MSDIPENCHRFWCAAQRRIDELFDGQYMNSKMQAAVSRLARPIGFTSAKDPKDWWTDAQLVKGLDLLAKITRRDLVAAARVNMDTKVGQEFVLIYGIAREEL